MSGISIVVEELLLSTISKNVLMPRKKRMDWTLMALSVLLAGAGFLFMAFALEQYLETLYEPYQAKLATGGVVMTLALLTGITSAWRHHKKGARRKQTQNDLIGDIQKLVEGLCSELIEPIRDNPKTAVLLASVVGFLAANQRPKS